MGRRIHVSDAKMFVFIQPLLGCIAYTLYRECCAQFARFYTIQRAGYALGMSLSLFLSPLVEASSAEQTPTWTDRLRVRTLHNIDLLLSWGVNKKQHFYPTITPLDQEVLYNHFSEMEAFSLRHNYFSLTSPLIGKVSSQPEDLAAICTLLQDLSQSSLRGTSFQLAAAELLTKVLAYRDLQWGQKIQIPLERNGTIQLETFTVNHIFDIWQGMPAFGLVPERDHTPSILLFRGTDFSLISKRGIASVMSDLDPAGPGLRVFFRARKEIRGWLRSVQQQNKSACVMGFSLGGALAAYTFIYENTFLSGEPSLSLCAPGVAPPVIKAFNRLPSDRKSGLISYVNLGDLVSQFGRLFGTVYCLSSDTPLRPLTAHTTLMSTQSPLYKTLLDTTQIPVNSPSFSLSPLKH